MTEQEFIQKLSDLHKKHRTDIENLHGDADDLLLEFVRANGFTKAADAWQGLYDEVGGFWYA